MNNNLKKISISKLFFDNNYLVPIYQRNYAWEEKHIEQLIDDINDFKDSENDYFLGNLIVNQRESNLFEVIDGQQRLTTLYLLQKNLGISLPKESLLFEAREKSNQTLSHLNRDNNIINNDLDSSEIIEGYKIINNYFEVNGLKKEEIRNKLKKVFLIRIQVPKNIDLNHYFEIMNTRGEQLELHEIAKARILNELKKDDDIKVAALIWEKCSEMNSYVQMNFPKYLRKYLFNEDWSCISDSIVNFDSIVNKIKDADEKEFEKQKKNKTEKILEIEYSKMSLRKILIENKTTIKINNEFDEENRRFESIISFPNFLLHISTILNPSDKEDSNLDDNHFLNNISKAWLNQDSAKYFLYHLLKCRVLFDSFIIKREYVSEDKETVNWSLQRLVKYKDKKE
ncbi:MAG: DUF262 domain-containing protein, partial [Leptospiraceae bacterium]|nr:DUF262 domain-containing protein [Leptospiraceae bacterium]